jgi:ABC-type sugar transport system ATPase subunit
MSEVGEVVYEAKRLTKRFGAITACQDVDLQIRAGRLTAIVGDNGAGKSTVVKIMTGALTPDSGTLSLMGQPLTLGSPLDARLRGIEAVYQELALAPNLDVASNIFLGRELTRPVLGIPFIRRLDNARMRALTGQEIRRLNVKIPRHVGLPIGRMSGGQRQSVAVARAAYWTSSVLFMDEPTAALGHQESTAVLELVRRILSDGVAVVMVSHILPHVIQLADHVVVMRQGEKVADLEAAGVEIEDLIKMIVGA